MAVIAILISNIAYAKNELLLNECEIFYPNGDWQYVPVKVQFDIAPSSENKKIEMALNCLILGKNMPDNCYDEIPDTANISKVQQKGSTTYIHFSNELENSIDNVNYCYDVIIDIIGYNVFNLNNTETIIFYLGEKRYELIKKIGRSTFFASSESNTVNDSKKEEILHLLKDKSKEEVEKIIQEYFASIKNYDPTITKIVIDPGHGGTDPGAIATYEGNQVYEKTLDLDIGLELRDYLEEHDYTIYMTRTTDTTVSLTARYTLANNNNVDLFISVHCNSCGTPSVDGTTCIYPNNHDIAYSYDAAYWMHHFVQLWNFDEYSEPYEDVRNLAVLRNTTMPAVITETGFMSNSSDLEYLMSAANREDIAESIHIGVQMWDVYGEW
jgi:N-acetylmuramoyl-L-alanine amidase